MSALLLGRSGAATNELAAALDAVVGEPPPDVTISGTAWNWASEVEVWAQGVAAGAPAAHIALCTWAPAAPPVSLADQDPRDWAEAVEVELAIWSRGIGAAAQRCTPGGSVVAVVERPSPLDAFGRVATLAVAEGLVGFARSAALAHGPRNVRVNVVATALWTAPQDLLGSAPPLSGFPGTVGHEVAGAVRILWSDDACGISGTVIRADLGRSW